MYSSVKKQLKAVYKQMDNPGITNYANHLPRQTDRQTYRYSHTHTHTHTHTQTHTRVMHGHVVKPMLTYMKYV